MSDKPSYLTDETADKIDYESTDNSHIMDSDVETYDLVSLKAGTEIEIPSAHEIESEISRLKAKNPSPKEKFEAYSSFFNMVVDSISDHKFSMLARWDYWFMDKYHATNANTYNQWDFTAQVSNARIQGEKVEDLLEDAKETAFDDVWKFKQDANALANNEECGSNYNDGYEEARNSDLWEMVDYTVWWKGVFDLYLAGKSEELAGEVLSDALEVSEVIYQSDQIAEQTRLTNPEKQEVDLYLPEADVTVQVKRGDGGAPKGEYDLLARYHEPDTDGSGREARLEVRANPHK